jgi:hypothetical protein
LSFWVSRKTQPPDAASAAKEGGGNAAQKLKVSIKFNKSNSAFEKSLNFVTNDEAATLAIDYQSLKFQL